MSVQIPRNSVKELGINIIVPVILIAKQGYFAWLFLNSGVAKAANVFLKTFMDTKNSNLMDN